ncbi:hypothetical protein NLJ89_g12312 [Agrocybe chaxingu]|uniref:Uncharacterized protein n=1 Tax=Agrocybe chaxingu TaxID=84603 RepID=A0A9W8MP71_9AGAR|nr:hypothetical protein NLJ89_g12312 [Agrocybe chaxingu]
MHHITTRLPSSLDLHPPHYPPFVLRHLTPSLRCTRPGSIRRWMHRARRGEVPPLAGLNPQIHVMDQPPYLPSSPPTPTQYPGTLDDVLD